MRLSVTLAIPWREQKEAPEKKPKPDGEVPQLPDGSLQLDASFLLAKTPLPKAFHNSFTRPV